MCVSANHNNDLSGVMITGLPAWNVTFNPQRSTIFMPCNSSGFFDPASAATFGIADFYWPRFQATLGQHLAHDV